MDIINGNYMFKELFDYFKTELNSDSDLLIIGYSYGDTHINDLIKENINKNSPIVINVNPNDKYSNSDYENLLDLNDISEF